MIKQEEDSAMKKNPPSQNSQRSQLYEYNSTKKWHDEKEWKLRQQRKQAVEDTSNFDMTFKPKTNSSYNSKVVRGDFFSRQQKRMDREQEKLTKIREEVQNYDFKPRLCTSSLKMANNASRKSLHQKTMSSVNAQSYSRYPDMEFEDRENHQIWENTNHQSNSQKSFAHPGECKAVEAPVSKLQKDKNLFWKANSGGSSVVTPSGNKKNGITSTNRIGKLPSEGTFSSNVVGVNGYNIPQNVEIKRGDHENKWGAGGINVHSRSSLGFYNGSVGSRVNLVGYFD